MDNEQEFNLFVKAECPKCNNKAFLTKVIDLEDNGMDKLFYCVYCDCSWITTSKVKDEHIFLRSRESKWRPTEQEKQKMKGLRPIKA